MPEMPPKLLPVEEFSGVSQADGNEASWAMSFKGSSDSGASGSGSTQGIPLDPTPDYLKMEQGGVGFPKEGFFDRIGAVLPVGGEEVLLLASLEDGHPGDSRNR